MKKWLPLVLAACCVAGFASTAHATVINIGCAPTSDEGTAVSCIVDECVETGEYHETVGFEFFQFAPELAILSPQWTPGYFFLVDASYNTATPGTGVKDVVVLGGGSIRYYSEDYAGGDGIYNSFQDVVDHVLAGDIQVLDVTNTAVSNGYGQQSAVPSGGTDYSPFAGHSIGLFTETANLVISLACGGDRSGCGDTLTITTDLACCNGSELTAVPEPATLTLVAAGGAIAAFRRRRKSTR